MTDTLQDSPTPDGAATDRPLGPALLRGWSNRCPACGEGRVLHSYVKVHDSCDACGEQLHRARADDGPAYLTILIVGHIVAPLLLIVFEAYRPDPLVLFGIFATASLALSLFLLPRLKGVVVAFQWARRMHGFGRID